jgi:hypothetical protein
MTKLESIVLDCAPVRETTTGETLYERFRREPDTLAVAVLGQDGRPVGLIERHSFTLKMAAEFGRALFARRPVSFLMDKDSLVVEAKVEAASSCAGPCSTAPPTCCAASSSRKAAAISASARRSSSCA